MTTEIFEVKQAIENLNDLTEAHINAFDNQALPDIDNQTASRTRAFSKIKESVDKLMQEMGEVEKEDTIREIQEEIVPAVKELMSQNIRLESKIREHKSQLEASMKRLNSGRKAINGYGATALIGQQFNKVIATTN
ncbi:hypothetical protein [Desulfobacter latus]|uniref:Flagellar protein FlgN n=1 Tax=Desulfobacter latus TaxID=2292 RepID=A0A850TC40_9BACT|nr:hypothetical protein [Desulfobacter latus]NWH04946.1 hypothetical protein [Desulfobacter latus]